LQKLGVKLSMAAIGEPRENGFAERLVRTIKEVVIVYRPMEPVGRLSG
jgi:transposase InsO family protein